MTKHFLTILYYELYDKIISKVDQFFNKKLNNDRLEDKDLVDK